MNLAKRLYELQQIDFSVSNKAQPIRQWKLPVPTETFAVKGNNLWAVGTDGITVMALDDTARVTDHFTTSGNATSIQLMDNYALVGDGSGGLVIFEPRVHDFAQGFQNG